MADPLSITASVLTIIKVTGEVTFILKQFCDDASLVESTLSGLLNDVTGFQQVLKSMHETFIRDDISSSFEATGHIGNHWKNLARALKSGTETLERLRILLDSINTTKSFLDGPRKQLRLKTAIDQISTLRDQIQSYHGALQLSLSSIIFAGQSTIQHSTDMIAAVVIPNQNRLYEEFRSFGARLYAKIEQYERQTEHEAQQDAELASLHDLRDCIRAAADVVSAASTTMQSEVKGAASVKYGSDFGDLFVKDANEAMRRWMATNIVHEFEDANAPMPAPSEAGTLQTPTEYGSESDSDIEKDMVRALFSKGKKCKEMGNLPGAERQFRICLSRLHALSNSTNRASIQRPTVAGVSKVELLELLTDIYSTQGAWAKAKATMLERLAIVKRQTGSKSEAFLWDTMKLTEFLLKNKEFAEAQLHGRRSLQGFKKLRQTGYTGYEQCLVLLVQVCQEAENQEDEEAFAAMLEVHRTKMSTTVPAATVDRAASPPMPVPVPLSKIVPTSPKTSLMGRFDRMAWSAIAPAAEQTIRKDMTSLHDAPLSHSATETGPREKPVFAGILNADDTLEHRAAQGSPTTQGTLTPKLETDVTRMLFEGELQLPLPIDNKEGAGLDQAASPVIPSHSNNLFVTDDSPSVPVITGLESMITGTQQQAPSTGTPSIFSTDLSTLGRTGSSMLLSQASQSSRPTTPASTEQYHDLTSPIATLTSFCQNELGKTPVVMIGRGRTGYNAFVRIAAEDVRQDIAKVVGYETKEQAKNAAAKLAYETLSSLTLTHADTASVDEDKVMNQVELRSITDTNTGRKHDDYNVATTKPPRLTLDIRAATPHKGQTDTPYQLFLGTDHSAHVPVVTVNEQAMNMQDVWWQQPIRRNATTSRLHPSNERTKQISMTELADLRKEDLLTVGSSPRAISPTHRRTVSDSQLPTTSDDAEWVPGDDIALTVKRSKFLESNIVQPTVFDSPLVDTIPEKSSDNVEALYQKGSEPSVIQQEHKGRSVSSCSVCGLYSHELSEKAAVQHARNCLCGQLDTNQVDGDDKNHQDREIESNQNESMDRPVESCFVCDLPFEGLTDDAIALHVDRCLEEAFARSGTLEPDSPFELAMQRSSESLTQARSIDVEADNHLPSQATQSSEDVSRMFSQLLSQSASNVARRNILVLGDPLCGKTSLVKSWPTFDTPEVGESATPGDTHVKRVLVRDVPVDLHIYDLCNHLYGSPFKKWNRAFFDNAHCVLLCFSVQDWDSLDNVEEYWNQKADEWLQKVPKILVGCKDDTFADTVCAGGSRSGTSRVATQKAIELSNKIGALRYCPTTTKEMTGLDELFEYTAQTIFGVADRKAARKPTKMSRRLFFGKSTKSRS